MRVLVIGSGGREHALVYALTRSPSVRQVDCAPGNGGIGRLARLVPIAAVDLDGLVEHAARERYDLVVVGPEAPLCAGLADRLVARQVPVFGCSAAAAAIEGSKDFAKRLMVAAGVPTARFATFAEPAPAWRFAEELAASGPVVVKADGLAAGKGVVIAAGAVEARQAITSFLDGTTVGAAGGRVVVEELLVGREASCMALVDGEVVLPLPACEDHKTIGEGDRGPMTGGMGAISPTPVVSDALLAQVTREVLEPTARQLVAMGRPFRGLLYAGLMITAGGPRVLEFNCRFGDPETQPLLLRCRGDLAAALHGVATGQPRPLDFDDGAACCVVLAAAGYPGVVEKGAPIHGLDEAAALEGVVLFHGGTRRQGDGFVTDGGRVLGVTAGGPDLGTARQRAYAAVARIRFDGMQLRRDIGARGRSPGAR